MSSIPTEKRCKRSDGKRWRCRLPATAGNGYCEAHYQQGIRRQRKQPVPDHLKLERTTRTTKLNNNNIIIPPKLEQDFTNLPLEKGKRIENEGSVSSPAVHFAVKEPVIDDVEESVINCDHEEETNALNREKKFDSDKRKQLHLIRELLPVMKKMNQEKFTELEIEAKNKGISHSELQVQVAKHSRKECSFCKGCIPDAHRSCDSCPYTLCVVCCREFRDGYLHLSVENLKETKIIRSKNTRNRSSKFCLDGIIRCPPKNLGGCDEGILQLTSFYPFHLTKDLEESAMQILRNYKFKKLYGLYDSSPCLWCDETDEAGLYYSTKEEFKDNKLEHFMKHWGKGRPIVIRDVFQCQPDVNWEFGFMLCKYLEKSADSRSNTKTISSKITRDWCEIEFSRKQIFSGGITHGNVWNEFLKFKLRFSSSFLQDHFPVHYNTVIQSLPLQEYMNPFTGFLNLGAYSPNQTRNPNLSSNVSISYGGSNNPMDADRLSNLHVHAFDVVNILVHASDRPLPERVINEAKMLMNKYNSQDHLKSLKKIATRNKLEGMFASSTRSKNTPNHEEVLVSDESESESESDEDDFSEDANTCGAHWDIFHRKDVPKLLEYLRKYSDKLSRSHGSPKKVVHPLFDEVFYLDDDHNTRLKEEFNVDAMSFEQAVGEAVIVPAGCPYQIKKLKSCVNVVYEFMSPESALESIKVSDDVRLLPVNHKAKGNMVQVKKMAIDRMQATIEELQKVSVPQTERWS